MLPRVGFFVSLTADLCYSVDPCSDRDTILVLPSLTPEKVGLPGSELRGSRIVMMSRCKQWFRCGSTFCTLEWNVNFALKGNLQLKYETKKYFIKGFLCYMKLSGLKDFNNLLKAEHVKAEYSKKNSQDFIFLQKKSC